MSNDTRNYYERELDQIDFNGPHPAKVLIGSEGKTTRTLDINKESAAALIHRLTAFLLNPEPKETPTAPLCLQTRPGCFFRFKKGRDRNGNALVRITTGEGRGFSIQSAGNLPQTHRDGVGAYTLAEVLDYVKDYGTKRQRSIMGL